MPGPHYAGEGRKADAVAHLALARSQNTETGILGNTKDKGSRSDVAAFLCVPSMALILLVKVQSRVFTAKCSEPQVGTSNGMDEGSGVTKFLSLRTET